MKKLLYTAAAALMLASLFVQAGCSTTTRENSEAMAQKGQTTLAYQGIPGDKNDIKKAVLLSLGRRNWNIVSDGDPIVAQISNRGQNAKLSIEISDGKIVFETKGSNIGGQPYVPIRYVDMLMKTVRAELK